VIAATNRDLESAYRDGDFRKDLFFRLNVVTIHMPSLRERKSDIPTLVHWFLDKYAPKQMVQVSSEAMKCMLNYAWPGNVRELENCIERAVALGTDNLLEVSDLPPALQSGSEPVAIQAQNVAENDLEELEKETIQRVFDQVRGDKVLAGKMLGISRATLYRKLKRYQIGERSMSATVG
jgi:two-component system response regulator AtoC